MGFVIREMARTEIGFATEQAARQGWNPGLDDGSIFYETDPDGFFLGLVDDKPMGCISAVSYESEFAFIGFYIVLPEFRGEGYGRQLGEAALKRLQSVPSIGLDGVLEQQKNYEKAGFRFAYNNSRYEYKNSAPHFTSQKSEIVTSVNFQELEHYDCQCFPAQRKAFLEKWILAKSAKTYYWIEAGRLKGYGVIRKCVNGYKIGPLFADSESIARNLFFALSSFVKPGELIYIDIPEINLASIRLVNDFKMKSVFKTARMYMGQTPFIQLNKIFGVTSYELG